MWEEGNEEAKQFIGLWTYKKPGMSKGLSLAQKWSQFFSQQVELLYTYMDFWLEMD